MLLQNVYLADGSTEKPPVLINLLVQENKLEIVSEDPIPADGSVVVVDAREGYLLGKLEIGKAPSFLILDSDPTDDVEILLDTNAHAIFAVSEGRLLRNNLYSVVELEPSEPSKTVTWKAYNPPPMALPLSYVDTTKWNRWESKYVSGIFLAGLVVDRMHWGSQDAASEQHNPDLDSYSGGEVRGFRLGAVGTINFKRPWVYTVFGATNAFDKGFEVEDQDDFTMFDYRLDIPVFSQANVSVGNQKEPISMERLMSMAYISMQERTSVSDAFLPSRNFGIVVSGMALDQRMTWAGGVFNNWVNASGGIGDNATQTMGRVTWLPFVTADESNLVHLGLGLRYSNGKSGVHYQTEPEFNKSPTFVDTDFLDANNSQHLVLEASWRRGPLWVNGEYVDASVDSPTAGDLSFSGYHASATWALTGEMRPYNKKSGIFGAMPVAQGTYEGGKGAWELTTRYSSIDLSDGPIDGGEMDILSFGVNWWLSPVFNVNLNYRYIMLDRDGFDSNSNGLMGRVLLMLE